MPLTEVHASQQRTGQIVLGQPDGFFQHIAFGQIGSNRTGEGAARTMRIRIVDALPVVPFDRVAGHQHIIGLLTEMAALAQYIHSMRLADLTGRSCQRLLRVNLLPGQGFQLRYVRRDQLGQREQLLLQCRDCLIRDKLRTTGRHHHRINHDMPGLILPETVRDNTDQGS